MARVPLEELVLQIHLLGLGPAAQFLSKVSPRMEGPHMVTHPLGTLRGSGEDLGGLGIFQGMPHQILS